MKDNIANATLAGLLHDIGKFLNRASPQAAGNQAQGQAGRGARHAEAGVIFVRDNTPTPNRVVEEAVRYHHQPQAASDHGLELTHSTQPTPINLSCHILNEPNQNYLLNFYVANATTIT